jgi:hypothetical protein
MANEGVLAMKTGYAACAALALMALPTAAWAVEAGPTDNEIRAMHRYVACIANADPNDATAVLLLDPASEPFRTGVRRLGRSHQNCLSRRDHLPADATLFAGSLAERLVEQRSRPSGLAHLIAADPSQAPIQARDQIDMLALCTVRGAPDQTSALFATPPASPAEHTALQALGPTLVNCFPTGQQLRLVPSTLRSAMAMAALRLVATAPTH